MLNFSKTSVMVISNLRLCSSTLLWMGREAEGSVWVGCGGGRKGANSHFGNLPNGDCGNLRLDFLS